MPYAGRQESLSDKALIIFLSLMLYVGKQGLEMTKVSVIVAALIAKRKGVAAHTYNPSVKGVIAREL